MWHPLLTFYLHPGPCVPRLSHELLALAARCWSVGPHSGKKLAEEYRREDAESRKGEEEKKRREWASC